MTYVSVLDERVVGYYAIAVASVTAEPSDLLHLLLPVKDIDLAFRPPVNSAETRASRHKVTTPDEHPPSHRAGPAG